MGRFSESPLGVAVMSIAFSIVIPVVAVAGLASCSGSRPVLGAPVAADTGAEVQAEVGVVGDSLTVGQFATLPVAAAQRGMKLEISAQVGRRIPESIEEIRRVAVGRELLVMALGTNDAQPDLTADAADALIDEAFAAAGPDTRVLWLTVYRDPSSAEGPAVEVFNLALTRAVPRHPNLAIADWAAVVRGQPGLMADDGVHLSDAGYATRSRWMVHQVAALLAPA